MKKHFLLLICCLNLCQLIHSQGLSSRTEAKIDLAQTQYDLSGDGVLTIMMDRGIDYRHPDFIDAEGNTRLAYIFDLYDNSGANDPDNPFGVGTIHDSTEINAALQNESAPIANDLFGHGTATTGIMAGNGSGASPNENFRGVAYNAKIISIVVTKDFVAPFDNNPGQAGQFDPSLLPIAFQFAEQKIAELNLPSVTLLNIGSIQDPTDGSIPLCDIIDSYVASGHPFVCGVGDDGGKDNHLIKSLIQGQSTEIAIQKGEAGNLRFSGWYSEDDRFEFTIERPNGQIEGPFTPPSGPNDAQDDFLSQISIFHRGANVEFANSDANLRQLLIDFSGAIGTYKINVIPSLINADGSMNAFLNPSLYSNDNAFLNNNTPGGNINSFSACPATISPGDYVASNSWVDVNGIPRMKVGEGAPGELWIGSSIGPTMDGRLGIDLVAPGEIASAAYGEGSFYASFAFNTLEGSQGFYGIQTAVSAAAPMVTGVIALMLELKPNLTPSEIKSILQETAIGDSFTGTTPNTIWGHGKLDALAAVERVFQIVSTEETNPSNYKLNISPNPTSGHLVINYPDFLPNRLSLSLYSLDGRKLEDFLISSGEQIDLNHLASGMYILRTNSVEHDIIAQRIVIE